jgi:hypothetical protein
MINKISRFLYGGARASRDVNAVEQSFKQGSLMPLVRRIFNKWLGRTVVSKLWWK